MSHSRFINLFSPFDKCESEDRTTHNHTTDEQTQKAGNITRVLRFFLLSAGCPAAPFPFLSSHLGMDRRTGGGTTGVGAEAANTEMEREAQKEGLKPMREEDTTAAAVHGGFTQQMKGGQISHREHQKEGVEAQREVETQGWRKGWRSIKTPAGAAHMWQADLHKYTPHAHARSHQSTQLTQTPSHPKCLWLQQRLQMLERNKTSQLDWKRGRMKK